MRDYLKNILVWLDIGLSVIFAPILNILFAPAKFGSPYETLSEIFGEHSHECKWCFRICKLLHLLDRDHCKKSIKHNEPWDK